MTRIASGNQALITCDSMARTLPVTMLPALVLLMSGVALAWRPGDILLHSEDTLLGGTQVYNARQTPHAIAVNIGELLSACSDICQFYRPSVRDGPRHSRLHRPPVLLDRRSRWHYVRRDGGRRYFRCFDKHYEQGSSLDDRSLCPWLGAARQ